MTFIFGGILKKIAVDRDFPLTQMAIIPQFLDKDWARWRHDILGAWLKVGPSIPKTLKQQEEMSKCYEMLRSIIYIYIYLYYYTIIYYIPMKPNCHFQAAIPSPSRSIRLSPSGYVWVVTVHGRGSQSGVPQGPHRWLACTTHKIHRLFITPWISAS